MLPVQSLMPLALMTLLLLVASLYGLAALGHFPRAAHLRGSSAPVLWGSMAVVMAATLIAIATAWLVIPWYAAIIAGGAAVLVAPLLLQYFSDEFADGPQALLWFSGASLAPAIGLAWIVAQGY